MYQLTIYLKRKKELIEIEAEVKLYRVYSHDEEFPFCSAFSGKSVKNFEQSLD
jgi:hypothetical protein